MRNKENRICDFIDFVVAPIEFDKQRKNLATIRNIHTHTTTTTIEKKKNVRAHEFELKPIARETISSYN